MERVKKLHARNASAKKKMTLLELENLFVEKLSEKFQLTARDISKAFKRFDSDGSGSLDKRELAAAIHLFVNGVDLSLVQELVNAYDVDGDGRIDLNEFTKFLISRNSANPAEWITVNHLTSSSDSVNDDEDVEYETASIISSSHGGERASNEMKDDGSLEYKVKMYLQTLKSSVMKRAHEFKSQNSISSVQRLSSHALPLLESMARGCIAKAFQPYTQAKGSLTVDFPTFTRVLTRFNYPGCAPPKENILRYLFEWCDRVSKESRGACDENTINKVVDPDFLIDLLFQKEHDRINQFGFRQQVKAASNVGRPSIGKGPIVYNPTAPPPSTSSVPYRLNIRHSRTALASPSDFDVADIIRSAAPPAYEPQRSYVYGMNTQLYSKECIHVVDDTGDMLMYSSAAIGVLHNTSTNTQTFLEGHDDDITCICISPCKRFAATGQMGRSPTSRVWNISSNENIAIVGKGFFSRGVCAVAFSHDSKLLCAVSCDDKHQLGIWDWATGVLLADGQGIQGVPPQIHSLSFSPTPHHTPYISSDSGHDGLCDVLCSAGVRHIKFWSLRRPTSHLPSASLVSRPTRMGKVSVDVPQAYECTVWGQEGTRELYAGGNNGYIYKWRDCICSSASMVVSGGIFSMRMGGNGYSGVEGGLIFCGGAKGVVALVDSQSLNVLFLLSILPKLEPAAPNSCVFLQRPSSSSNSRPSSSSRGVIGSSNSSGAGGGSRPKTALTSGRSGSKKTTSTKSSITLGDPKPPPFPEGAKATADVLGMDLVWQGSGTQRKVSALIAVTGFGRLMRVEVPSLRTITNQSSDVDCDAQTVLYYHHGPVWALAINRSHSFTPSRTENVFLTGGDDKWLCLWGSESNKLLARARTRTPIKCIDMASIKVWGGGGGSGTVEGGGFVAVGGARGGLVIYFAEMEGSSKGSIGVFQRTNLSATWKMTEIVNRKDCLEDISDIKFSPNSKMMAVGNHDNFIDIYAISCALSIITNGGGKERMTTSPTCTLRPLRRLKGHSSYITHLDWSADNRLIQSTCGAYELLYWDVSNGRQLLSSSDSLEADTKWNTITCTLGFNVMGIWPQNSDGTDVNSLDVCRRLNVVATGGDNGQVSLFYYPCITSGAAKRIGSGHSSHVMNVRFLHENNSHSSASTSASEDTTSTSKIVSVGGNDCSVMMWRLRRVRKVL